MSIQQIGLSSLFSNSSAVTSLQGISSLPQPSQTQQSGQVSDPDAASDSAGISQASQFLSKLEQLKQQDPAQFKQVLSQIADKLTAAAQQQTQGTDSQFLTQLADKFRNAAQTGDLSQLQPPAGGHHGHHHHVAQAYAQNQQDPTQLLLSSAQNSGQSTGLTSNTQNLLASVFQQVNNTALS
jgi:hypothetical protein